jgi:hypothetical protein
MVEDPAEYPWCGYARALVGEKESAKGLLRVWGKQRGLKGALAEYRVYLFEEGSEDKTQDGETQDTRAGGETEDRRNEDRRYERSRKAKIQDPKTGEMKTRMAIDARKVWEERKRGGRLPLHVILRLKSRYLVDGAAIGSAEFLRRLAGKANGRSKTDSLQDSLLRPTGYEGQAKPKTKEAGQSAEATDSSVEMDAEWQGQGKPGVPMRFGQWGGLRVLRDLRVRVVG